VGAVIGEEVAGAGQLTGEVVGVAEEGLVCWAGYHAFEGAWVGEVRGVLAGCLALPGGWVCELGGDWAGGGGAGGYAQQLGAVAEC
jgi:hypothetical protein